MKRNAYFYLKVLFLWLFLIYCGGQEAYAQHDVVRNDTTERNDSLPLNPIRGRKTASGHGRKEKIGEKTDSAVLKKQMETDSIKVAAATLKRDPDAARKAKEEQNKTSAKFGDTLTIDSVVIQTQSDSLLRKVLAKGKKTQFKPDPIRSMWLGLVFPGGGQIYNRKYWKLPIFYGGFLGCAYALTWNGQMLRDYSQAYLDIMDTDPNTKSYEKMLPLGYDITGKEERFKTIFKNKKNYFRKYRDMSIFAFAGVYLLAVIDAYVDAELSSFDISHDLSMRLSPALISSGPNGSLMQRYSSPGIQCNITF